MKDIIKKYSSAAIFSAFYLLMAFLFSVFAYFFNLTDEALSVGGFVLSVAFLLISSVFSARKAQKKGWLAGMVSGGVFMLIVLAVSFIISGGGISLRKLFIRLPLYIFVSFIGGVMGINMR